MGKYVNPNSIGFARIRRCTDYVDKTGLISYINGVLGTAQSLICSTRPRRFGKSFAVQMLTSYYSKGCKSAELYQDLKIAQDPSFTLYLNNCDVISWDTISFMFRVVDNCDPVTLMNRELCDDLKREFPEISDDPCADFPALLFNLCTKTGRRFIFIIDEWDAIFRERKQDQQLQRRYLDFLRQLFKGSNAAETVQGVYMTGILPIKKYGTESALTDFREFTMVNPGKIGQFVGFTKEEVAQLCEKHGMDPAEMRRWYDGYVLLNTGHIFCPNSVMNAIAYGSFGSYWTQSETYTSLRDYIELNFDGLKKTIVAMLGGQVCFIDPQCFQNDLTSLKSKDDVLTLLVHLGYLGYNGTEQSVFIPNEEIRREFVRTIKTSSREEFLQLIKTCDEVLDATLSRDHERLAILIEKIHNNQGSLKFYNNEQALRATVRTAYLTSQDSYNRIEETEGGKGYADMAFVPKKGNLNPAFVIELKWNQSADAALSQIRERNYAEAFRRHDYSGDVLLIGISYDPNTRRHACAIDVIAV